MFQLISLELAKKKQQKKKSVKQIMPIKLMTVFCQHVYMYNMWPANNNHMFASSQ